MIEISNVRFFLAMVKSDRDFTFMAKSELCYSYHSAKSVFNVLENLDEDIPMQLLFFLIMDPQSNRVQNGLTHCLEKRWFFDFLKPVEKNPFLIYFCAILKSWWLFIGEMIVTIVMNELIFLNGANQRSLQSLVLELGFFLNLSWFCLFIYFFFEFLHF